MPTETTRGVSRYTGTTSDEAKLLVRTEARRSTTTSELWLTIASFAAIVIAGYVSDTFTTERAWTLAAIVMAAYLVSRGLAKAGSGTAKFWVAPET